MLNAKETRAIAKALKILETNFKLNTNFFDSPSQTKNYLRLRLGTLDHEQFHVMFLNNRHALIECECLSIGTIDGAAVYPREIVRKALAYNAAAVIVAHNHPSGVSEPSQSDYNITDRIKAALETVDICLLDHIIVTSQMTVSFSERGWI